LSFSAACDLAEYPVRSNSQATPRLVQGAITGADYMGRHERRASLAAFRREASDELITHLIGADEPLDDQPLLKKAVAYWRGNVQRRRPFCFVCKAPFDDEVRAGAFLFATTAEPAPTSASVSAACTECWRNLSPHEIEDAALRVMQKLLRGARWQR
jgi:hypothetical protein